MSFLSIKKIKYSLLNIFVIFNLFNKFKRFSLRIEKNIYKIPLSFFLPAKNEKYKSFLNLSSVPSKNVSNIISSLYLFLFAFFILKTAKSFSQIIFL